MIAFASGALDGVRVIDLTRVLGGPYCTQILGDHGADIIKVESEHGDETRAWGPPFHEGTAAYFLGVNRNKRSIVLDLAGSSGRDALLDLLSEADVLVENFKTGTLEKWGLGHDAVLAKRFPRLVHCRITGYGDDGPLGGVPGYDAAVQAIAGLMSVNGERSGGPLRVGIPLVDIATGMNAALGILLALFERDRSGRGQLVETTLFDTAVAILHPHLVNYFFSGETPRRTGNAHPNITPYDVFATATTPIFLAVGNDRQFAALCRVLGRPVLSADPRFPSNALRTRNRDDLKTELEALMQGRSCEGLVAELTDQGVPCSPVGDVASLAAHPHTRHRGMIAEIDGVRAPAPPIKLSRTPASVRRPPPNLGEHDREILAPPANSDRGLE
ncbi:MAG: CoA transferase [Bauldia sp.]|nr:CoA transferase [Bauldia sp.]